MAERSITAKLRADISGLKSSLRQARQEIKGVGDEAAQTGKRSNVSFDSMAKSIESKEQSLNTVARGLTGIGLAAGAGFAAAVKSAATFDQAMSGVKSTGDDARANQELLRQSALKWGADTKYSATEAAGGIENLLKAGVSAKDVMGGGLEGALSLAAAGELEVADAAEIAATALTQFNLEGSDVPHVADLLAAGAGKAQGEVSDLAAALNQSGLVASQFGLSVEETTGTLSAFASSGLLGSDAGTSFKTMLLSLANPAEKTAGLMKDLGINAYDAQGNFVGISELAGQLQSQLGGLTQAQRDQALAQIFGNDAVRAANVLFKEGESGINQWIADVDDAGYASETAATKMDNLQGDLETLKGAFETALIGAGSGQQAPLRDLVQTLTTLVDKWNELDGATQSNIARVVGALALVGLGGAAVIKVVQGAAAMRNALTDLGITGVEAGATKGSRALQGLGKAAGVAAVGFAALQVIGTVADNVQGKFNPNLTETNRLIAELGDSTPGATQNLDAFFQAQGKGAGQVTGLSEAIEILNSKGFQFQDWLRNLAGAQSDIDVINEKLGSLDDSLVAMVQNGSLEEAQAAFTQLSEEWVKQGGTIEELLPHFDSYQATLRQQAEQLGVFNLTQKDYVAWMGGRVPDAVDKAAKAANKSTSANKKTANSLEDVAGEAQDTEKSIDELVESLFAMERQALGAEDAAIGYEQALDDAHKEAKEGKKTLDIHTQAGRDNRRALQNIATSAHSLIEEQVRQGKSTKEVTRKTKDAREEFIRVAEKMGASRKQAEKLADKYGLIPKDVKTKVSAPGIGNTQDELDKLNSKVVRLKDKDVNVEYTVSASGTELRFPSGLTASAYAEGGYTGAGGKWDPAGIVHRGEVVFDQPAVAAAGGPGVLDGFRQALKSGQASLPGYAGGGIVGRNIDINTHFPPAGPMSRVFRSAEEVIHSAASKGLKKAVDEAGFAGMAGGKAIPMGSGDLVSWRGGTFTDNFAKHLQMVYNRIPFSVTQGGFSRSVAASGTSHYGDAVDIGNPVTNTLVQALRNVGIAAWDRTGRGPWHPHIHAVPLPGAGRAGGSGIWQAQDYLRGGDGLWTGTDNASRGWHATAERGAELVMSPQMRWYRGGETVLNANDTAAALGGSSTVINIYGAMDKMAAARELKELLEMHGRATGSVQIKVGG